MQSSLGLAGDLDDVELIEDIEASFGTRFSDDDLKHCRTVGDLFTVVKARLPSADAGERCATAMCFFRMRRALQPLLGAELRPSTSIEQLSGLSVRELYDVLKDDCGLRPPPSVISIWGCIALMLVGLLPLASIGLALTWWLAAASALPAIGLYSLAPIRLPKDVATFGDLVRIVSARNIGILSDQGARLRVPEAWTALRDIIADHTILPKQDIALDTLIYTRKKAAS